MTSRGNERLDIFPDDRDRKKSLGILDEYHEQSVKGLMSNIKT